MDAIDKRNVREKIARSVIKRNYVHYMTQEELEEKKSKEQEEQAKEIYERLQAEAAADEAKKQKEIEEAVRLQKSFNATTNAYSGEYGKDIPGDEVTKGQIEKILSEKQEEFERTLEEQLDK